MSFDPMEVAISWCGGIEHADDRLQNFDTYMDVVTEAYAEAITLGYTTHSRAVSR